MIELDVLVSDDVLGVQRHHSMHNPVVKVLVGEARHHRGCPLRGALVDVHLPSNGILITIRLARGLDLRLRLDDSADRGWNWRLILAIVNQSHGARGLVCDLPVVVLGNR